MNIVVLQLSDAFRGVYYNMEAEGASACVPVAEGGQALLFVHCHLLL